MKSSPKILLTILLVGIGITAISYFTQEATYAPVTFSFALEQQPQSEIGAPMSNVILKGSAEGLLFKDIVLGENTGCSVTEKELFDFEDSIAEVYCYYAGGGQLFQAKETPSGDLEVFSYTVSEVPNYEDKTYSIEITNPQSIYTFDLLKTQYIVK